jgi:hypothetical protein
MAENPGVHFHSSKGDNREKWDMVSPVPLTPDDVCQRWRDELQTEYVPTSGSGLLYYLTNYCSARSIALYGIDGLQSPVWHKQRDFVHPPCHSSVVIWKTSCESFLMSRSIRRMRSAGDGPKSARV